jgi:hypothetical protein
VSGDAGGDEEEIYKYIIDTQSIGEPRNTQLMEGNS